MVKGRFHKPVWATTRSDDRKPDPNRMEMEACHAVLASAFTARSRNRKPSTKAPLGHLSKEWHAFGMPFDLDTFAASDTTADLMLTGTLRKLVRRGYGISDVEQVRTATEHIDAVHGATGKRSTRRWEIRIAGAPGLPDFAGVLAVRETGIVYGADDSAGQPSPRWYELLPDCVETVKVLKAHDGY